MFLFRLLRLPNLLIVALVQILLYFHLLLPAFAEAGIDPRLRVFEFGLLVVATLCMTACGYIINDVYDYEMDLLNRRGRVVVGQYISPQNCIWLYVSLGFLGWFLSLYLAFRVGEVALSGLYIFSFGILFLYTTEFKKRPLLGNLVVAFFCAGVAILVWFAEAPAWWALLDQSVPRALVLQSLLSWYAGFAFMSTLFREIVKDLEDREGDRLAGCRTFPIVAGERAAKLLASAVAAILILSVCAMYFWRVAGFSPRFYTGALLGVILPLMYAIWRLQSAHTAAEFHLLSQLSKWIMLAGIWLLLL